MALLTTPLAGEPSQGTIALRHALLEGALLAAVLVFLLPMFAPLAVDDTGRGARFAATAVAIRGLPDPLLPDLCATYGRSAEAMVSDRLCRGVRAISTPDRGEGLPASLAAAHLQIREAFLAPLNEAQARVATLRDQQRQGQGDVHALAQAVEAAEADVQPFVLRYGMIGGGTDAPRPVECAFEGTQAVLSNSTRLPPDLAGAVRASAFLLLGAALDAHPATASAATSATLPLQAATPGPCASIALPEALTETAAVMSDARAAPATAQKNGAIRALLRTAGWQWLGGALIGFAVLTLSRSRTPPLVGIALALSAWAAAGWVVRVPWPLASEHAFVLARGAEALAGRPADFIVVLLSLAATLLVLAPWRRAALPWRPQAPGSVFAYPGLVMAVGVGWLVLLDLSANAHYGNRYLALYHQGHLWLGMMAFSVALFLRQSFGRGVAWTLSIAEAAAGRVTRGLGTTAGATLLLMLALVATAAVASLLANTRQLTSEIGRLWLMTGAAWFFFLRGTPLAERLARGGSTLGSLVRYLWPLLFVVIVLVAAMLVTRDMGPLLIAGYGAGAFVAASVALWRYQRSGKAASAYAIAVLLFAGWIAGTTTALFRFGALDPVTATRLENTAAPLASANDQLALVTWFQRAAPADGYGPGAVPWCGFRTTGACAGVPGQIQSDYTFTALVGVFGWVAAWALTLGCVAWLHEIARGHARATRGEPRMVRIHGRVASDEQAFLSWLCVAWVVLALCQLAVTVAGNLAVIPLTGVTFPFVSFGMTSLVVNLVMLGLAMNVNRAREAARD